ncbi:hypothetical protein [Acinetobacter genomosp. 15BJ]|uniref:Uncharacterized protein n=1 Tax=Acinetobacter genomosp. 15BJ TaxID=106651 RepID=R9AZL2_9GAMM|nr:hypothetical protein [Acinetobacter genomosp. 15BJ]EOR07623.1 hypothetical protein F896_01996 [Acinetobacter genomosp. 15BJ]MCH7292185.1 hypothetical protein [Acinetobacter genomosp. 15BJ]MDO3656114.1 hypothetical protein [Acinetobacter genomosp. 15BJ]
MASRHRIFLKYLAILGFVASSAVSSVTFASSEQAWNKHDQEIKKACIKASQLKSAKTVSNIMLFDDRVGYSALLIEGKYPQAHMKNKTGQELCLWNKTSKKAYLTEASTKVH